MAYSASLIRAFLDMKLDCGQWDSIHDYSDIHTEEYEGRTLVFGQFYDFTNYDTASDEQLEALESGEYLYKVEGKEVFIFKWLNRKINTWAKDMADRLSQS